MVCVYESSAHFFVHSQGDAGKKMEMGVTGFPWIHLFYLVYRRASGIYCIHELLLSRQPLILTDVMKEAWEHQASINVSLTQPVNMSECFSSAK